MVRTMGGSYFSAGRAETPHAPLNLPTSQDRASLCNSLLQPPGQTPGQDRGLNTFSMCSTSWG